VIDPSPGADARPDDDYEAWSSVSANGERVVSTPDGELVVWSADRPRDS